MPNFPRFPACCLCFFCALQLEETPVDAAADKKTLDAVAAAAALTDKIA
jgi:hypothetical protein